MQPIDSSHAFDEDAPATSARSQPAQDLRLLSSVCHDMKAPLASIVVGTSFLRKVLPKDDAAAQRVVDAMARAANRMDQLIVSFGDLGRLQMHELELDIREHRIGEIVERAFEQLNADAVAHGLTASVEISPDVASQHVSCDRSRLAQALSQLGACVLRVAPEAGRLTVRVTLDSDGVRLELIARAMGDGRPIAADLPSPQLAIAQGLIELHGGRLSITREVHAVTLSFGLSTRPD